MARLASQAKMGYYPTPTSEVENIERVLTIAPGARLLDTCCGEGDALRIIAEGKDVETYGIELDRGRCAVAKEQLDHVLLADALYEVRVQKEGFGLLWLNPPYDDSAGYEDRDRLVTYPSLKGGAWAPEVTSLSQGAKAPSGYVIPVMTPWGALSQLQALSPGIKQAYGVEASVSGMTSRDNIGEAHFTGVRREKPT